jgi:hypothetical protein
MLCYHIINQYKLVKFDLVNRNLLGLFYVHAGVLEGGVNIAGSLANLQFQLHHK